MLARGYRRWDWGVVGGLAGSRWGRSVWICWRKAWDLLDATTNGVVVIELERSIEDDAEQV